MKTKQRFVCPKHGTHCESVFNRTSGGKFFACRVCYKMGDQFTVEGAEPFKAYGNVAEEFGQYGVSQELQTFPTVHEEKKSLQREEYESMLRSITPTEESDFRELRKFVESFIHSIGPRYRKMGLDDVRNDLLELRQRDAGHV